MKTSYRLLRWAGVAVCVSVLAFCVARTFSDGAPTSTRTLRVVPHDGVASSRVTVPVPIVVSQPIAGPEVRLGALQRALSSLFGRIDVCGDVVDADGVSVASAIVRGVPDSEACAIDFSTGVEVRADEDGRFRLRLPCGTERVALRATTDDAARGSITLRRIVPPRWGRLEAGTLVLQRPVGITGRIVDGSGNPVAGARIVPYNDDRPDAPSPGEARSQSDGTFALACVDAEEPMRLIVLHPEHGLVLDAIARCGGEPTTIVLGPPSFVHGQVLDERGSPVIGARVEASSLPLHCLPPTLFTELRTTVTDSRGEYRLRLVPTEGLVIAATALGLAAPFQEIALIEGGDEEVDFTLTRVGTISGVVVNAVTGKPIEGAIVSDAEVPTNPAGRFVASLPDRESPFFLDDGTLRLGASKPGFVREWITVSFADAGREARIELRPAATIRGLVLDPEGRPLDRTSVMVPDPHDWHRVFTNSEGAFVVDTLAAGHYEGLWVSHRSYPSLRLPEFDIREGETRELTCIVGWGRGVRGRVVARDSGATVANARVTLWRWDERWFGDASCRSNARGEFSMRGFAAGPTWVVAAAEGFAPAAVPITLPPEAGTFAAVEVTLGGGLVVEGDAVDASGAPVAQAWVSVHSDVPAPLNTFFERRAVKTDAGGHFRIGDLSDAPLRIGARLITFEPQIFRGADDIRLRPPFDRVRLVLETKPWPFPPR